MQGDRGFCEERRRERAGRRKEEGKEEGDIMSFRWVGGIDNEIIALFFWLPETIWTLRQNVFVNPQMIHTIICSLRSCVIALDSATAI